MEIVNMPISDLVPYEKNPRNNEMAVEKVAKSIKEFGFQVPIVVDKDNVILAGHTRLLAAKELGLDSVPVIVAKNLDDVRAKAFRLADNKVAEFSGWNFDLLDEELAGLTDIDINMTDFGFDDIVNTNLDDLFVDDTTTKEKKTKTITCPHCGEEIQL
jgi:ParB-like chromosome segregation protein Spo0J